MSSRHARKIISSLSKFQRISVQNKSAYEGADNKYFSWLPFGWKRASYQENFDGNTDTFNSTGIVADSIFVYANPEAASLQHERIFSDSKGPAERMLDQQTTHSHPKLKELHRRRSGLPVDANKVKDSLTDEQKKFIDKLKLDPNSPPNLDTFNASPRNYSLTGESISGKDQRMTLTSTGLPYWAKAETYATIAASKNAPQEGVYSPRNKPKYWVDAKDYSNVKREVRDGVNHLCESDKLCQIEKRSSLTSKKKFSSASPDIRFYSSINSPSLPKTSQDPTKEHGPFFYGCGPSGPVELRGCKRREKAPRRFKASEENNGDCDPSMRNTAISSTSPMSSQSTRFMSRLTEPGSSAWTFKTARRFYSKQKDSKDKKPPEGPKPKKKELGDWLRSESPNQCPSRKDNCDPTIKPFKNANAAKTLVSPMSCLSAPTKSRISEPTFKIPNRFYSSKKKSDKEPEKKPKSKKDVNNYDYFNEKSPNECPKDRSICDPTIKPYRKGAATSSESPISCPSRPMSSRISEPRSRTSPFTTPSRFYSKKMTDEKPEKPCFESKKIAPKVDELADMGSPVACKKPEGEAGGRCDRTKCGPSSIPCEKPPPIHAWKCPKKPASAKRRNKKVKVVGRQMLLGYKVCKEPPKIHAFQCFPKANAGQGAKTRPVPTPKKCPCFEPISFESQSASTCRKMPNAVEPDCNRVGTEPAEPKGKCQKEC